MKKLFLHFFIDIFLALKLVPESAGTELHCSTVFSFKCKPQSIHSFHGHSEVVDKKGLSVFLLQFILANCNFNGSSKNKVKQF